jgi:hypothetical protein
MSGEVACDSCRKAEMHGGCSMLAAGTMRVAWLMLSLAVGWLPSSSPLTAHAQRLSTDVTGLRSY